MAQGGYCLVYEATKGDELKIQVSKMEALNQRASLDFDAQLKKGSSLGFKTSFLG